MKIAEITEFSAGICGVWARVFSESKEFAKLGHEVLVLSSNIEKGTDKIAKREETIDGITIKRMESQRTLSQLLSKNVTNFDFKKELSAFKPDIVITHLLHPHSFKAVKLCNNLGTPCYLVTHAPFNVDRKFPLNIVTKIFNYFNSTKIPKFTKIISITKWEIPYLKKMGVTDNKIEYIPNGLPDEFLTQPKSPITKDILFLGRIAPVKNLEMIVQAAKLLPSINFDIVGQAEEDYLHKLQALIKKLGVKNVNILPPIWDLKEKIKIIDEHEIFILPSTREAMPIALLEAMARGKLVISSMTDGGKEVVTNENGFLFKTGDYNQLADIIKTNIHNKRVIVPTTKFLWRNIMLKYLKLFKK